MKIWNNLSKRGLALFLVLTMCVSLLPATALATELEELNHIHNEDGWVCEEAQGDLTCDIEEHRHSDECYAPGEPVLSCALTEDEGHTHGDSCYSEEENLTLACGLEEGEGHAHDEACFTGGEGVLVCETAEHTHGGECYETVWSCASPSKNIQRFLRAVRDIPEEITAADEGAVIAARQAYDLLTEDELPNPAVVVGLVTLEHAETVLDAVKAETDEPGEEEPTEPETPELVIPEDATVVTPDLLLKAAYGQTMSVESFFGLVQSSKTVGENPPATLTFVGEGLETVFLYEEAAAYTEQITVEEYAILLDGAEMTVYAQGEAEAAGGSNALAEVAETTISMMVGEQLDLNNVDSSGSWSNITKGNQRTDTTIAEVTSSGNIWKTYTLRAKKVGETVIQYKDNGRGGSDETTIYRVVVTPQPPVIRFDANGGSGSVDDLLFDSEGDAVTLPSGTGLSRDNYMFLGWAEQPDVNTVSSNTTPEDLRIYESGEEYVTDKTGVITLYAVWGQVSGSWSGKLTVAVRADGVAPSEPSVNHDKYYYLTPEGGKSVSNILDYVNPAHTVAGVDAVKGRLTSTFYQYVADNDDDLYLENKNGQPIKFDPETQEIEWYVIKYQSNNGGEWHIDGTVKDKAKVSLNYDGNGSTGGLAPNGREYAAGTSVTVEWRDGLVKRGYAFDSWNTKRDGSGDSYREGDTITLTKNTTLYAQWIPNDSTGYTVKHYLEGADGTYLEKDVISEPKRARTDSTVTATAKQIDGFTFDSGNSGNVMSGRVEADGSLVLKLYYTRNSYTVTYDPNGGASTSTEMMFENLKYGAATPTIAEPTREGYTFTGWTPEVAGTVTGDVTYVAQWEEDTTATKELFYTVQYYKNGNPDGTAERYTESVWVNSPQTTLSIQEDSVVVFDKFGAEFDCVKIMLGDEPFDAYTLPAAVADGTAIKVYYVQKFTVTYTDGVTDKVIFNDDVHDVKFGDPVPGTKLTSEELKRNDGYKFDGWSPEVSTGTVTDNLTYTAKWIPDPAQTKELSYTVEYYKDGVKEGEPETITETVQFLETQVPVKAGKINTTGKFETPAYRFDKVVIGNQDVGTLPATVAPGTTIKVYYVSNTAAYTVEYYYGATESTVKGNAPTLYAEAADGAYITYAAPAGDTAVIGTDVTVTPARFVKVGETCYVLWKVEPVTIQADPAPNAVKVHYLADTDGDGIPDAFQSKATYYVTGGSWSTDENVPEKTQVLTFKTWNEASGDWVDTFPAPAFETSPPTANSDYDPESGKWDENDPVQVSERPGMGKTYTFRYSFDLMYGYTVRYHFVDKNRQPVQGCEREDANEKDRLDAGQSYVAVGTVVELSKLPEVVTFGSGGSTKKFVIVSGNTDRTVQRKTGGNPNVNVFDVYYGVDEIGTNNGPDDVADCFQATVTFAVVGGSWNHGSTGAPLVVTLTNPQGELDENGSYTLTGTDNIPEAGQNPDGTHRAAKDTDTNLWAPALSTPVTKDNHAFTYTYPSKNTMTVTVEGINRPYNGTEGAISVTVRDGGTALADAAIKYYSDAAYEKEIAPFNNSFKDVADSTTIYIRVTHPDYTAVDTHAVVAITPVAVTVTADNKEMVYGGEMPKLTATVSGILTGEEGELAYKLDCAASSGSHAGEYAITVTGKQLNNYDVSYVSGTLTIKGQVFYKENAPRATDVTGMPERPTERHKAYKLGEEVPHTDLSTKVPVRKGYTFAGWSLASGEGNAVLANDEKVIMGETGVTLYAVWTQNTYTVKVNYRLTENGKDLEDYTNHTLPTSKDVGYPNGWSVAPTPGATITAPENIVVDDKTYVLDGSLSSETLSGVAPKYEGPGTSVEVTLVYALDSNGNTTPDYLERFSLTYDANGGKGEVPADPKEYAQYEKATLEKTTSLSKDKAVFIGWSLTKHEELITSKETAGGAGIVSDVTFALADITVYAVWAEDENENDKPDYEEDRFTVTYTDGVDGAEIFEDQVYEDVLVDTPTPAFDGTPRRTGYTFTGWDPAVAGTVTADAAYTAQWRRNTYTITIEVINGTSNPEGSVTVSYNGSTTIHFSGNPGYELGFVTVDGKPAALASSAYTFSNVDRNHKIQVLYTQSTFTVTFVDGLTGETIEVRPGLVELPGEGAYPAAPAHEGYEFTGWTVGAPGANGNVTITANYKPIEVEEDTYTVTFVDGLTGETIEVRAGLVELPGEGTYPAAPAHEGYEFTGWTVGAPDANGNVTITANYKPIEVEEETFTVTFVDGLTGETIEVRTGLVELPGEGTYPAAPAHEGYEFTGWTVGAPDANGNVVITANYKPAEVEEDTYTVTWLNWNGVQLQQKVVKKGDPEPSYTGLPPTRLSDGVFSYTFIGWSAPSVDAGGNVTYTAQYTATRIPVDPGPGPGPGPDPGPAPGPGPGGGDVTIPDNDPPLAGGDGTVTINDQEVPLAGAIGLNSVDHFAYIIGYDDDTVRPLNNITRAEVATIFFRLMTEDYRNANWATANDFSDVTAGSWFNNAVSTCANAGLLTGYPDGTFKPNQSITRAEFAAVAARFLSNEYTGENVGDFSDTKDHWAAKEIRRAAEAGWVTGSNNGFRPNDKINRAEVMTIVNRMLDRIPDAEHMLGTMKKWKDNPEDAWYYEAVQEATNEHAYERDELGVTEHWTEVLPASDWKNLEAAWANANTGKADEADESTEPTESAETVETVAP